jgi:hypothetical protein
MTSNRANKSKAAKQSAAPQRKTGKQPNQSKTSPFKNRPARTPAGGSKFKRSWRTCAINYLQALEDPFTAKAVCVPTSFTAPSQKVFWRSNGIVNTGTAGSGWVIASPFNGQITADSVYFTTSNYPGNSTYVPYSGDTGVDGVPNNSTNSNTLADDDLTVRLVAAGLRIRNVTPLMNRGCLVTGREQSQHATLMSNVSNSVSTVNELGQWMQFEDAERINTDSGDWASVVYHPIKEYEMDYFPCGSFSPSDTTITPGNFTLGFSLQASTSTAQVFEWEFVCVSEQIGRLAIGLTPSESDPQGLSQIVNIVSSVESRKPRIGDRLPILKRILNGANTFVGYAEDFIPLAKSMIAML